METIPSINNNDVEDKVVNTRPLFCIFIGLILGGLFTYSFIVDNVVLQILLIIITTIVAICLVLSVFLKSKLKSYFLIFILLIIFVGVGSLLTCKSFKSFSNYPLQNTEYIIEGRIKQVAKNENTITIVLQNIIVNNKKYDFNIKFSTLQSNLENDYIVVGNALKAKMQIENVSLINNGKINSSLSMDNIKYTAKLKEMIEYKIGSKTIAEKFCNKVQNVLLTNLSNEKSWLSYDILVGDRVNLQDDLYSLFKDCGLSHVLAVSGLHVGLIVVIIEFILKKLRLKQPYILLLMSFILILYCILCNFSPSVVRASIMAITYLVAECFGKRKDSLSVFSFAGIIILLIWPLHLFYIGFQLSFVAVFGIILLYKPIYNMFKHFNILSNIASSLSVTLSATIATFPIMASNFGELSIGTLFSNLIILPIFTLNYYILFISTLLGLIFNVSFIFLVVENIFNIIFSLGGVFSMLGSIEISNFNTITILMYLVVLFFATEYVNPKLKFKNIITLCMVFVLVVSVAICNTTKQYNQNYIFANSNIENCYVLTTKNNANYLIGVGSDGGEYEYNQIAKMLYYRNIFNVDAIIVLNYDVKFQDNIAMLSNKFKVKQIILNENVSQQDIRALSKYQKSNVFVHNFEKLLKLNEDICIRGYMLNNSYFAYNLCVNEKEFVILDKSLTQSRINYINENLKNKQLILYKDNLINSVNISYNVIKELNYSSDVKLKV